MPLQALFNEVWYILRHFPYHTVNIYFNDDVDMARTMYWLRKNYEDIYYYLLGFLIMDNTCLQIPSDELFDVAYCLYIICPPEEINQCQDTISHPSEVCY